jgi:hypothetical protein
MGKLSRQGFINLQEENAVLKRQLLDLNQQVLHRARELRAGANLLSSVRAVIQLTGDKAESPDLLAVSILLSDALHSSGAKLFEGANST